MTHLTLGSAVFSWLKENVVDMGFLVTQGQGKQCACRWLKSELSAEGTRGLMGSPKALVFLRAHLVLLPRRIHFLVLPLNASGPQQITGQVLICNRTAVLETSTWRKHPVPSERGSAIKQSSAGATRCPVCGGRFICLILLEVVRFFPHHLAITRVWKFWLPQSFPSYKTVTSVQ